ncbi:MAG: hypothetical protein ACKOBH_05130 [bacterium]
MNGARQPETMAIRSRRLWLGLALTAALSLAIAGCGSSGERQDADEPSGEFPVEVLEAKLPERQKLAETSNLVLEVRNSGSETIPDLAVTINTRASDLTVEEAGIANGSFSIRTDREDVAVKTRPVWILNADWPKLNGSDTSAGAQRVQTNTYAFGELAVGETATMTWNLNAVATGSYTVAWVLSAGLGGKAEAVDATGGPVQGEVTVEISGKPAKLRVDAQCNVVPVP